MMTTAWRKQLLGWIWGAACLSSPAWSMDLLQAYQAAQSNDATVRAARAAAESGRERLPQARAQWMPNVSFNAGRNRNDLSRTQENLLGNPVTTEEKYFSYNQTLQVRQPLFRKPLLALLDQADYQVVDANAGLAREEQNLAVRVTGAYLEALLAQDQLALVAKQKASTTVQLDAARKALAAGSGTRTDIDDAQARLDMLTAQELEARQGLDLTRRQLEVLTAQPVEGLAGLNRDQLDQWAVDPATLAGWVQQAEANSPEILALQARLEVARLEVTKAQGGHYPTLDAVAQVTRSASENVTTPSSQYSNRMVGLQLNVPLFSGGYVNSSVRQALAEQTRAEEILEATRRDLGVRLHREYKGVTEGALKVIAYEQTVQSAEQLVRSSRRSLEAGSRTVVDVLNAEDKLQTAQRDLAQARYMRLMAWVRLNALAGVAVTPVLEDVNRVFTP